MLKYVNQLNFKMQRAEYPNNKSVGVCWERDAVCVTDEILTILT